MSLNEYNEIFNELETTRKTAEFLGNLYYSDLKCDREMLHYAWKKAEAKMYELCAKLNAIQRGEE